MELVSNIFEPETTTAVRTDESIRVRKLVRRFEIYRDKLAGELYRKQWLKNYKLWRSYVDFTTYPHRSKLFIPITFQYIETVLPRVASNKVTLLVAPRRSADAQYMNPLNQVMRWSIGRNRLNVKWPTFAKQLIMHGYSVAMAFWNTDPLTGFPFPDFEVIDLFNFYVDPTAFPRLDMAPEAIIRVSTTMGMLRGRAKYGVYDKALIEKVSEAATPHSETLEPVTERHQAIGAGYEEEAEADDWKKVELLLHITPEKTTVIANRAIILKERDNFGTMPLVGCPWTEDPFHMFGLGQIEPAQALQHAINGTTNMMFDARALALRGVTLVGTANATTEDSKFQRKAGAIIRVTDVNQVRDHHSADVSGGIGEERMFYMGQAQEVHSAMDIVRGASGADETATQAQINNAAIETKLSAPTKNMEQAIEGLGTIWFGMLGKYMPPETLQALGHNDNEFPQGMTPEAFNAQIKFIPVIEPQAPLTKQFKRRTMQEAISGLLNLPQFPELMTSDPVLQGRIYSIALKYFDFDEGPELMQTIEQSLMKKMQAMAAPPAPAPAGMPGDMGQQPPMPPGPPPPQMQGPPPPPMEGPSQDATASILGQMTDEEIVQLMSMPPEQVSQILLALEQQQNSGRPEGMPAMQPAVRQGGVM
jgi:hypothetical protein